MNMDQYKVKERKHPIGEGVQIQYRFPNGYGASVIRFKINIASSESWVGGSYGSEDDLWELAVIKWDGDGYALNYDTPITDDVLGHLTDEQVQDTLKQIMELT